MNSFRHALATIAFGATAATVLTACHPSPGATGALQAALAATATADPGSTTTSAHAAATASAAATTTAAATVTADTTATADTTTTVTAPPSPAATSSAAASTTDPSASGAPPTPSPQPTRTATPTTPPTTTAAPTTTATPTTAPTATAPMTTAPTTPPQTTTAPPPADTSIAGQILALVNNERAKAGCRAVTLDSRLTRAAAGHSQDMAAHDYFSHTSLDGRSFVDRIRATGYTAARSENIAAGQPTPAAVMASWMNSPGHRANILDPTATQMGVASATGGSYGIYWTQDFGTA